jgi:hypothetical protein
MPHIIAVRAALGKLEHRQICLREACLERVL